MPEGPEVLMLSKAFKHLGFETEAIGKHLLIKDLHTGIRFDISFGLVGKITVDENLNITKVINNQLPSGDMKEIISFHEVAENLGIDWLSSSRSDIQNVVTKWTSRKKQIGSLLLDQHEICGIGIAWGSEILHKAGINPSEKANTFIFLSLTDPLIDAIISTKEKVIKLYSQVLKQDGRLFVNGWFNNLYKIRESSMSIYKKGIEVTVSGRTFYV